LADLAFDKLGVLEVYRDGSGEAGEGSFCVDGLLSGFILEIDRFFDETVRTSKPSSLTGNCSKRV
jgi:hypothetical protein